MDDPGVDVSLGHLGGWDERTQQSTTTGIGPTSRAAGVLVEVACGVLAYMLPSSHPPQRYPFGDSHFFRGGGCPKYNTPS